jgi:hypothetical protein
MCMMLHPDWLWAEDMGEAIRPAAAGLSVVIG